MRKLKYHEGYVMREINAFCNRENVGRIFLGVSVLGLAILMPAPKLEPVFGWGILALGLNGYAATKLNDYGTLAEAIISGLFTVADFTMLIYRVPEIPTQLGDFDTASKIGNLSWITNTVFVAHNGYKLWQARNAGGAGRIGVGATEVNDDYQPMPTMSLATSSDGGAV